MKFIPCFAHAKRFQEFFFADFDVKFMRILVFPHGPPTFRDNPYGFILKYMYIMYIALSVIIKTLS